MSTLTPLERANLAQHEAADPQASVFVTANAGSGKTKVLVDRIARLLLTDARPSSFLCITYTKAAAAEMQRRLFERLGGWCVADDEKLAKELKDLGAPEVNLGKARALFALALETPGGLRIQTIHAFCERLLGRFPIEAGVAPGFDIADEARAGLLLAMARATCIRGADEEGAAAFARFAARLTGESVEGLLDRLVQSRGAFAKYVKNQGGHAAAQAAIRKRHNVTHDADTFIAGCFGGVPWKDLHRAGEALRADGGKSNLAVAERIDGALSAYEGGPSREALTALMRIGCKEDGEPYKNIITKALADKSPWLVKVCTDVADAAKCARDTLNAIDRADDAQAALLLALRLDEAYAAAKTRYGALDFEDLITHAYALLSRSDAAPWVLYKLDGGIDHILVDEGQDTSPLQWDVIAPLQNEFFAGEGARERERTVFAVGDPKQSIYAFQGADPERFLREKQLLSARAYEVNRKFVAPALETSFRSAPEILRVVDAAFKDRDLAPGAPEQFDEVRHFASRENQPGIVEVWPIAKKPEVAQREPWDAPMDVETEASAAAVLAKQIARQAKTWIENSEGVWEKGKLRPMRPGDILALVRTRGALFRELIKAFKRAGLPVAGADRMTLKDELAVEDCLALMRVALDPADDLALACLLKGPWLGLDDEDADIFPLAHGREKGVTLYTRLMASTDAKYAEAKTFVTALLARSGEDAFAFLSWALETPDADGRTGWRRVLTRLGAEARDPIEELLQRALRPHAYAAPSLQRFLNEVETDEAQVKRELEAAGGTVRVMTVHGAKGLEAPVVILPDATAGISDKPEDGLIFTADGPFLSVSSKNEDAALAAARADHKERALGENRRLLYVAMTRACDRLIVCGPQWGGSNAGEAQESWRSIAWEAVQSEGGVECDTPFGKGLRIGAPTIVPQISATAKPLATIVPAFARTPVRAATQTEATAPSRLHRIDPAVFSPRGDGQARFRRGRLIHGLLQRLPDIALDKREASALRWLQRQGATPEDAKKLAAEALRVTSDERFAAVFAPSSRAEVPIVGEVNGRPVRGIVDRLAVTRERVLILDFKTDRPAPTKPEDAPEAYILQMAYYRAVMRKIFTESPVRCALLWTEAPHLMELDETLMSRVFEAHSRG